MFFTFFATGSGSKLWSEFFNFWLIHLPCPFKFVLSFSNHSSEFLMMKLLKLSPFKEQGIEKSLKRKSLRLTFSFFYIKFLGCTTFNVFTKMINPSPVIGQISNRKRGKIKPITYSDDNLSLLPCVHPTNSWMFSWIRNPHSDGHKLRSKWCRSTSQDNWWS